MTISLRMRIPKEGGVRFFIAKHPEDGLPYIHDVDPDPRTGDERFTEDGVDYSGWYVAESANLSEASTSSNASDLIVEVKRIPKEEK